MTEREKLIEDVQQVIEYFFGNDNSKECADIILDTIFKTLKEPSEQMQWDGDDNMHVGSPTKIWQAMLSASPLGEKAE